MDLLRERDLYLKQVRDGSFWRQDQRLSDWRDQLDASDPQPTDSFHMYFAGVVTGLIYGLFIGWLVFGGRK